MKTNLILATLMTVNFYANIAVAAGGVDGGGGKSVVCRNGAGAITSAELLDLYEGRVMYGLNIQKSTDPMNDQIQKALAVIPSTSRGLIEVYAKQIQKYMRLTPSGTELKPIDDSFEVVLPKDCAAEQLANYYNDKLILVNGEIWASLGETDRAALILHEAVYAANRIVGATNSRQSRYIVANVFDSATQWTDVKDQVPPTALTCISSSGGLFMWAYQNPSKNWVLQFQILGRSYVMSKKWIELYNKDFDFTEAKTFPIIPGEDLIGTGVSSTGFVSSAFEDSDVLTISKRWEAIKDSQGQVIKGFQTPRYYLSWTSGTFPKSSVLDQPLNCSVVMP